MSETDMPEHSPASSVTERSKQVRICTFVVVLVVLVLVVLVVVEVVAVTYG